MEKYLENIKKKIERLLKLYETSLTLNKSLSLKINILEQDNEKLKEEIKELNSSKNALKISTFANTLSENERGELKKTIKEYIKEIDDCIKTLDQ